MKVHRWIEYTSEAAIAIEKRTWKSCFLPCLFLFSSNQVRKKENYLEHWCQISAKSFQKYKVWSTFIFASNQASNQARKKESYVEHPCQMMILAHLTKLTNQLTKNENFWEDAHLRIWMCLLNAIDSGGLRHRETRNLA